MAIYLYRKLKASTAKNRYATGLANAMEAKLCTPVSSPGLDCTSIVNWGLSVIPSWDVPDVPWLNKPPAIKMSANKIKMQKLFASAGVPALTAFSYADRNKLENKELRQNYTIIGRRLVASHSGNGIVIIQPGETIPSDVKMCTVMEDFATEIRVFVVRGKIIDYSQKKRMGSAKLALIGLTEAHPVIRSHNNGWIFARQNIFPLSDEIREVAIKAIQSIGLDWGCVDIGYTDPTQPIVIEVNTAPGISPMTTEHVANAIKAELAE